MSFHTSLACCALFAIAAPASAQATTLESVNSQGLWGTYSDTSTYASLSANISGDGRVVGWDSGNTNLAPEDVNLYADVFVRDRVTGTVECVSVGQSGTTTQGFSSLTSLSYDGRYVLFWSESNSLVPNDTNGEWDVFLRDRVLGVTERVSVGTGGVQGDDYSLGGMVTDDGRFVLFTSLAGSFAPPDVPFTSDVFVRDRLTGTTELVSYDQSGAAGSGSSGAASMTQDARWVVFHSSSSTLLAGDANGKLDVFVRDRLTGSIERASVDSAGNEGDRDSWLGVISDDARWVAFESRSNNLVPGDTNGEWDIFLRDRQLGVTTRISADVFGGDADGPSDSVRITPDGRQLLFHSAATDLVAGDTNGFVDLFAHDRISGITKRVNLTWQDAEAQGDTCFSGHFSADGRMVVFSSNATNLTAHDRAVIETYLRDTLLSTTPIDLYCTAKQNSSGCTPKIATTGAPHVAGPDAFFLWAREVIPGKSGILFWGLQPHAASFLGGTLCVKPPLVRSAVMSTTPLLSQTNTCDAAYSYRFSQGEMASHGLVAGDTVYAQFWSRDPVFVPPDNVGLTDAARFTLVP